MITDIATASRFWNPVRLKNDNKYTDDYLKDCAEIDSRLLEEIENKKIVWSILRNSANYCLPGLFNTDDLSILIDEMLNNMYNNRKSNPDYEFKVITFSDMLDFIDTTASKINSKILLNKQGV